MVSRGREGARQPSVLRFALHYAWAFGVQAALRSPRWTAAQRVGSIVPLAFLLGPVSILAELAWILTGRAHAFRRVFGTGGVIVVVATGGTKRLTQRLIAEAQPEFEAIRAQGPPPRPQR
jgi:hypothetical protein